MSLTRNEQVAMIAHLEGVIEKLRTENSTLQSTIRNLRCTIADMAEEIGELHDALELDDF